MSLDNFPTPPWATRALQEHIIADAGPFRKMDCPEPACGAGHMARPLKEYFGKVRATDIHAYGHGAVADFLAGPLEAGSVDWVITNPPFRLAEEFIKRARSSRHGTALRSWPEPYSLRAWGDIAKFSSRRRPQIRSVYRASSDD